MTVGKAHHFVFSYMLKGLPKELFENHASDFLHQILPKKLYLPVYRELTAAQQRGDFVALLSNSPDFIVKQVARYLNINFSEGTIYAVDKEERLYRIEKLMTGTQKQKTVMKIQKKFGILGDHVTVYSDSYDDLPLFLQAGEPVTVNPDRKLRKIAKKRNWRVI